MYGDARAWVEPRDTKRRHKIGLIRNEEFVIDNWHSRARRRDRKVAAALALRGDFIIHFPGGEYIGEMHLQGEQRMISAIAIIYLQAGRTSEGKRAGEIKICRTSEE